MNVVGLERTLAALKDVGDKMVHALGGAMYREMTEVIADSQTLPPSVPVDTGALKNSKFVTLPRVSGHTIVVEAGYGGPATEYALRQHEELDYRHDGEGEGAKYLSTHFERRAATMDERMARDVKVVAGL